MLAIIYCEIKQAPNSCFLTFDFEKLICLSKVGLVFVLEKRTCGFVGITLISSFFVAPILFVTTFKSLV